MVGFNLALEHTDTNYYVNIGLVGVGGYLLQGGISFLSSQYGLAADVSCASSTVSLAPVLKWWFPNRVS